MFAIVTREAIMLHPPLPGSPAFGTKRTCKCTRKPDTKRFGSRGSSGTKRTCNPTVKKTGDKKMLNFLCFSLLSALFLSVPLSISHTHSHTHSIALDCSCSLYLCLVFVLQIAINGNKLNSYKNRNDREVCCKHSTECRIELKKQSITKLKVTDNNFKRGNKHITDAEIKRHRVQVRSL